MPLYSALSAETAVAVPACNMQEISHQAACELAASDKRTSSDEVSSSTRRGQCSFFDSTLGFRHVSSYCSSKLGKLEAALSREAGQLPVKVDVEQTSVSS